MNTFTIFENNRLTPLYVEPEAYEGVKRIGARVACDIGLVTGVEPEIMTTPQQCKSDRVVIFATLGKSPFLAALEASGRWSGAQIQGKREVYQMHVVSDPFSVLQEGSMVPVGITESVKEALVIAGSDKRGTIYGMFHLSELCGVSPLIYWGDVVPEKKESVILPVGDGFVSKEPSVRYRGFFINDEWPAFGNWCMEKFGGVNAKAYEEIFILLLRLKGNYLWPAMWDSIFSEEGPGLASAELADTYGVVMGTSHHEPLCRAGAEWQRIYQQYGTDNTWSFVTNKEAITEFWKDGILRNRPFENVITIGMRGENDSMLLSADAGLADNVQVIKDAIVTQHALLREYMDKDLKDIPRMLAIYKEVEDYYYGDATCEGLKGWEELDDVILLLCEDNFGNTRGLPDETDRKHPGGYGMYYHFDYHGGPISYEWQNTARLTKTWEQMTQAYEYGVRELWIVNVGDLKGAEYPLCYFMDLAYDYETYSQKNKTEEYVRTWIEQQFGNRLDNEDKKDLYVLLDGYTKWNAARHPEAMAPDIYHPCHFREAERVWNEVHSLMETAERLREHMPEACLAAYGSMIYYPAMASLNLILMHIEAGCNAFYAAQGSLAANACVASVKWRAVKDRQYVQEYHALAGGKWNHMMDSAHTGFHSWDAHNWTYPTVQEVIPLPAAKIVVGFRGGEAYHLGAHWQDNGYPCNDDFTRPDTRDVVIEIGSRGEVDFSYRIQCEKPWVCFGRSEGTVESLTKGKDDIVVTCDRSKLKGRERALIEIFVTFANGEKTVGRLELLAEEAAGNGYTAGAYIEKQGYIAMNANGFTEKKDVGGEGFAVIDHLGRMGAAVKAFPVTKSWLDAAEAPYLTYTFVAENTADYIVRFYLLPRNPVVKGARMCLAFSINGENRKILDTVSDSFRTDCVCGEWSRGVLDNIRVVESVVPVKKGENQLYFYAANPGIVLERIVLYPRNTRLPESYLGPVESWRIAGNTSGPKAPKDPTKKRQGFYIMRNKQVSGSAQPDGTGIQFIYLNDGRMISSAKIVGNITDDEMLGLLSTAEGFRRLVHSIGVSVEMDGADKRAVFALQMYGKSDTYGSGTTLRMEVPADGMEYILNLSDCGWSDDDDIPGQIRFEFDEPQEDGAAAQALATVRFYLNDGFSAPEPEEEENVDFACAAYQEMLRKSVVQTGNNARLKAAIERAKRGEEVTVAFIGGSITQGAGAVPINTKCYAWQTFEGLCRLAGKGVDENLHYIKAGVGGTPSELGMIRYERDVCRDGAVMPDIVVVEFAVNDEGDETKGVCYESLVRKILAAENKPAVILLFAVFANDWNLQERLGVVGERYHLPMVSTRDCVVEQFYKKAGEGKVVTKNQFFYDCFHPTNIGHRIMADGLLALMQEVDKSPMDEDTLELQSVPAVIGAAFEQVWLYDRNSETDAVKIVSTGDFTETDEELQGVEMNRDLTQTKEFPYNWKHVQGAEPFVMEVCCTSLVMVNKDSGAPDAGCAEVFVDGEKVLFADPKVNGWTHCNPLICFQGRERRTWRVEVRMQPGDEDREFTILGFGIVS